MRKTQRVHDESMTGSICRTCDF